GRIDRVQLDAALALRDAIMEASPTPVLLFDSSAHLVRVNSAAREAIPDLEIGATLALQRVATAVHEALAGRQARPFEVTVYEPERRRFHAHLRVYRDRSARACAVVLADESAEADYRDARRLFSAGVSHELRTPLARMLALVDTLSLPSDTGESEALLDQMRLEIDAMRQLIEDMMLLTRLESEGVGEGELVDVATAVHECVERQIEAAQSAGVDLTAAVAPGVVAVVPRRLLDVVLDNLVENAIRHAGSGARVDVRARGLAGAVELEVADTGAGIPAEHLGRVFERFHRVEGSRTGPGTGLGLAIVKHIAESRRGRVGIESIEGAGTTVRVVLPAPATGS
ncbi:MAG: two-component system, OmpR family, phosphate regulon sensor histidine kinase PhoR, partial [Gaiellales bacterium]|nr:two-component system, OmpR family, phosphate regulon sensor histidine kinase PhoR [Gaiellales bacterium]